MLHLTRTPVAWLSGSLTYMVPLYRLPPLLRKGNCTYCFHMNRIVIAAVGGGGGYLREVFETKPIWVDQTVKKADVDKNRFSECSLVKEQACRPYHLNYLAQGWPGRWPIRREMGWGWIGVIGT